MKFKVNHYSISKLYISFIFVLGLLLFFMIIWIYSKNIEGNANMNVMTPEKAAIEVAESASQTAMRISQDSNEEVKKSVSTVVAAANLAAQSVLTGNKNPVEMINNVNNVNNVNNAIKKKRKF